MVMDIRGRFSKVTNPHLSSSVNGIPDAALHKFKHLLQKRSISKEIVLALGTYNMKDFVLNLECSLKKLGITNYLIGALDNNLLAFCSRRKIPVFSAASLDRNPSNLPSADVGTQEFNQLCMRKLQAVLVALDLGYSVLVTDIDVVWLRDARGLMRNSTEDGMDMVFQCSASPERNNCSASTGFFYARPTPAARQSLNWVIHSQLQVPEFVDQDILNHIFCERGSRVGNFQCAEPTFGANIRMLPSKVLPDSSTLQEYNNKIGLVMSWESYIVHFNGIKGPKEKKKQMKKDKLWLLGFTGACKVR